MKKIYTLLAFAAILSVAGCKKADVSVETPDDETDDRVPVLFSLGQPSYDVSVKSVGGVDAWDGHELYIFGYPTDAADYSENNAFIYNVKGTTLGTEEVGYNATTQTLEVTHEVTYDDGQGPQTAEEPFFYNADNTTYDFYGYYVDDAVISDNLDEEGNPIPVIVTETTADTPQGDGTTLGEGVYIPFTIDGSQDLMTALADKTSDILNANPSGSVKESQAYSAYAARRSVQPNLKFQHQLTRFKFEIKSGSLSGNSVKVNSISLKSPAKGYLCVVGENQGITIAADDTPAQMTLMQKNADGTCEALQPATPATYTDASTSVTATSVGESIMVIPEQASYELTIQTSMDGIHTPINPQTYTLTPAMVDTDGQGTEATAFEAGKEYIITLTVYGLEQVIPTVTLGKWTPGGNVDIDPDDQFNQSEPEDPDAGTDAPDTGTEEPEPEPGTDENPETPEPQP